LILAPIEVKSPESFCAVFFSVTKRPKEALVTLYKKQTTRRGLEMESGK
jgi:hypothetical protein